MISVFSQHIRIGKKKTKKTENKTKHKTKQNKTIFIYPPSPHPKKEKENIFMLLYQMNKNLIQVIL